MPSTSDEVNRFANSLIQLVKNGEENPLAVLIQIRGMEKAFKIITEKIQENLLTEADKYPEKKFQFKGNDVDKSELGTRYNFDICGDRVYETRKSIAAAANTLVKEREEFLKALKEPLSTFDEETGEVFTIRPPSKSSTSGLKITLK